IRHLRLAAHPPVARHSFPPRRSSDLLLCCTMPSQTFWEGCLSLTAPATAPRVHDGEGAASTQRSFHASPQTFLRRRHRRPRDDLGPVHPVRCREAALQEKCEE